MAWATAHPYLAFLLGLTALNVIGFALSPPCAGWRALSPGCAPPESVGGNPPWPLFNIVLPAGNSVYHGLVRR